MNNLITVTWKTKDTKKGVAGFLVEENEKEVIISPTLGIKGFLDKVTIPKKEIIERKDLIC